MEFNGGFSDLMKNVIHKTTNFVTKNPLYSFFGYVNERLQLFLFDVAFVNRIATAVFCRLLFGTWLRTLRVIPFQVFEKNDYYEDPGVVEMHALLRGEDCSSDNLDQRQQLPFPPANYDPYDKIYLAVFFYRLQREFRRLQESLDQNHNAVFQKISSLSMYQSFSRYLTSRVAVNINIEN